MTASVDTNILQDLGLMRQTPTNKPKSDMGQGDFLTLMLTQLKNQDPTKPMESGEFLGQIAQFGTVTGIKGLQTSFDQLSSAMQSNQTLQASMLAGKKVLVQGGDIGYLPQVGGLNGAVELTSSAADVVVGIYDNGGQLVRQMNLGPQAAGRMRFSWDGKTDNGDMLAPGMYAVRAAARIGNETVNVEPMLEQTVQSVSLNGAGKVPLLNVTGGRVIELSMVKEIR